MDEPTGITLAESLMFGWMEMAWNGLNVWNVWFGWMIGNFTNVWKS